MVEAFTRTHAAIDLMAKVVISLAIPGGTFVLNRQISAQTQMIEEQKRVFEQSMKTREEDVELTLKFYDIINSKRFDCFDETQAPLLGIIVRQHNAYNKILIDEAQVVQSLVQQALHDPSCRVSQDSRFVRDDRGGVPTATSAGLDTAPGAGSSANALIKAAYDKVTSAQASIPASERAQPSIAPASLPTGADGWAAIGRNNAQFGFTNFSVLFSDQAKVDKRGGIASDAILRARWSVFLRLNNSETTQGGNPVLGVLSEGTCVRVKSSVPDLRGQTWAAVTIQPKCPDGDYK